MYACMYVYVCMYNGAPIPLFTLIYNAVAEQLAPVGLMCRRTNVS